VAARGAVVLGRMGRGGGATALERGVATVHVTDAVEAVGVAVVAVGAALVPTASDNWHWQLASGTGPKHMKISF